jgi:transposase-like protein
LKKFWNAVSVSQFAFKHMLLPMTNSKQDRYRTPCVRLVVASTFSAYEPQQVTKTIATGAEVFRPTQRGGAAKDAAPAQPTLAALAAAERISEATLCEWRREAREQGRLPPDGARAPDSWSAADKFAAVVDTAVLNEAELSAYCRKRGLPEQVPAWRTAWSCSYSRNEPDVIGNHVDLLGPG